MNKENITFLIAVIGFLLSLWNFLKELWYNRSKINIRFKNQAPIISLGDKCLRIELSIENKSRIPISISRMFLVYKDIEYEFEWIPRLVVYDHIKEQNNIHDIMKNCTLALPTTIPGLGVYGGYFIAVINEDFYSDIKNDYFLKIQTNRKKFVFYPPKDYQQNDGNRIQ